MPLRDRVAFALATGLGIGYAPVAPGTFGSVPAVLLAWGLARLAGGWAVAAAAAVFALAGVWAADRVASRLGETDPGLVVVDEVAGQLLTLTFVPINARVAVAAFLAFRLFDILKPWPANRLEELPGGSGIMADDLMAGLYANLILHGLVAWRPAWMGLA